MFSSKYHNIFYIDICSFLLKALKINIKTNSLRLLSTYFRVLQKNISTASTLLHKHWFYKRNFAKISQNSHKKHPCQSLFFNKVATWGLQLYQKRDSGTSIFLWILRNFSRTFYFTELLRTTAKSKHYYCKKNKGCKLTQ